MRSRQTKRNSSPFLWNVSRQVLTLGDTDDLIYDRDMKPSRFIAHYERQLGRPLTISELGKVNEARSTSAGKRDTVKAMRLALLSLTPQARPGYRDIEAV